MNQLSYPNYAHNPYIHVHVHDVLPDHDHYDEEKTKQHIANVTEDIVKGTEDTKGTGTLEVVVALVLVTTEVENLVKEGGGGRGEGKGGRRERGRGEGEVERRWRRGRRERAIINHYQIKNRHQFLLLAGLTLCSESTS